MLMMKYWVLQFYVRDRQVKSLEIVEGFAVFKVYGFAQWLTYLTS